MVSSAPGDGRGGGGGERVWFGLQPSKVNGAGGGGEAMATNVPCQTTQRELEHMSSTTEAQNTLAKFKASKRQYRQP